MDTNLCSEIRVYILFPVMLDANTCIHSNIIKMSWNITKPIFTIGFIQSKSKSTPLPFLPVDS